MDCRSLKEQGLFPGPDETEDEFKERVRLLKKRSDVAHETSREVVKRLFGCAPTWVPIEYSNKGLSLWEGAATWIEKGTVRIQLKKGFQKGVYLGIYRRDEVVAHELVHLCRMAYSEPKYEEVFAYLTSKSKLRRLFGPLFRRPYESALFILSAFLPLIALFGGNGVWFPVLWSVPLLYFSYLTSRLTRAHRLLGRCLKRLAPFAERPLELAFLLTDREIQMFSRMTKEQIQIYFSSESSFRGEFLRNIYGL